MSDSAGEERCGTFSVETEGPAQRHCLALKCGGAVPLNVPLAVHAQLRGGGADRMRTPCFRLSEGRAMHNPCLPETFH